MNLREIYNELGNSAKNELVKEYKATFSSSVKSFYNAINRKVSLNEKQLVFFAQKLNLDLNTLLKDEYENAKNNSIVDSATSNRGEKKRSYRGAKRANKTA